jgi:hypothetical protein
VSEQFVVALIGAGGLIGAALVTAILTRRHPRTSPPKNTDEARKEDQPMNPSPPVLPPSAPPPTTLGELLQLMHQRNVKCLKGTAEALIGRFEFADITNTGLPSECQALICRGDGTHTGRWNNEPAVISRVGRATLARNVGELRQQLGLNG